AQAGKREVEHGEHLRRIGAPPRVDPRPEVQRVENADEDERDKDDRARHGGPGLEDASPRRRKVRPAAAGPALARDRGEPQPKHGVGRQEDGKEGHGYSSRILGSTTVYERSVRRSPRM